MIKLKNLLNEQSSNNIRLKRIRSNNLGKGQREDKFVVTISYNGNPDKQYKIEVYRFIENEESGTTVYFQDEDIMDNEDSIDEFNGVENQDVYQAVLDFYESTEQKPEYN
jgi:hypothetical protein